MANIACVVVTYNRKKDLINNLEALLNQTNEDFDIILVDNASTDGTREAIDKYLQLEKVHYYNTGSNLGGAGGFNYGLKIALSDNYSYSWIMDDDTIPDCDALDSLVKKASLLGGRFSFLASVVKWRDGTACRMNIPYFNKDWFSDLEKDKFGLIKIDSCSFVSCFINNNYSKKVGYPISEFFIYGDDLEYTLRLSREEQGYLDTSSYVMHNTKDNVSDDISRAANEKVDRYFYRFRNMLYISRKYKNITYTDYFIGLIKGIIKIILFSPGKRFKRIRVMFKGACLGISFEPAVELYQ